ncbi:MAG: BON domain-containing protein [Alphaproteobacteria bacterium]|nr:BON domain-containing protein [Alphaproteobacteria bacterium]
MTKTRALLAFASLLTVISCAPIQGQETAGQYVDDVTISNKVRAALVADKNVSATQVHVETLQGVVNLTGFVKSSTAKARAEQLAGQVAGVKSVQDDIIVK